MKAALLSVLQHHSAMLPLAVLIAAGVVSLVMRFWRVPATGNLLVRTQNRRFWISLCVIVVAGYLLILFCNVAYPGYLEHVEPTIASVAYVFLHGAPLYQGLDSTQRYAFPYGPAGFLSYGLALRVMGANVLSLKLVVLLANLILLGLLWSAYRRVLDPARAVLVGVGVIAYLLMSGDYVL